MQVYSRRPIVWGSVLALVVIILDQFSKMLIVTQVMVPPRMVEVTPFFNLTLVHNTGVSFGILNNGGPWNAWLLSGFAVVVSLALLWWLSKAETRLQVSGLALIIGGALGNVIDRLAHGAVIDFLDFHAGGYHWPAFNVADAAICIGAAILVGEMLFVRRKPTHEG